MIYKVSSFIRDTNVNAVISDEDKDNLLPKIVFFNNEQQFVIRTMDEQNTYQQERNAENELNIIYPNEDLELVFGSDYSLLIFRTNSESLVFSSPIPAPVLTGELNNEDNPVLEWTNSYQISTKVYRTAIYTGQTPSEFILVGEVEGYSTPGGTSSYEDTITLDVGDKVTYFVENENGMSNTITLQNS
jgi:hypothetical protein